MQQAPPSRKEQQQQRKKTKHSSQRRPHVTSAPFVFWALSEYDTPANTATIFNPAALFQEEYPAAEKYLWALLRVSDTHHAVVKIIRIV